jgi:hypothetical protein
VLCISVCGGTHVTTLSSQQVLLKGADKVHLHSDTNHCQTVLLSGFMYVSRRAVFGTRYWLTNLSVVTHVQRHQIIGSGTRCNITITNQPKMSQQGSTSILQDVVVYYKCSSAGTGGKHNRTLERTWRSGIKTCRDTVAADIELSEGSGGRAWG